MWEVCGVWSSWLWPAFRGRPRPDSGRGPDGALPTVPVWLQVGTPMPGAIPWFYGQGQSSSSATNPPSGEANSEALPSEDEQPHSSRKRPREGGEEDYVDLLDSAEALEFVEFDPSVDPKDSWPAPSSVATFLEKHFNRSLSSEEREAIIKDFPRPNCDALVTPKIDELKSS